MELVSVNNDGSYARVPVHAPVHAPKRTPGPVPEGAPAHGSSRRHESIERE